MLWSSRFKSGSSNTGEVAPAGSSMSDRERYLRIGFVTGSGRRVFFVGAFCVASAVEGVDDGAVVSDVVVAPAAVLFESLSDRKGSRPSRSLVVASFGGGTGSTDVCNGPYSHVTSESLSLSTRRDRTSEREPDREARGESKKIEVIISKMHRCWLCTTHQLTN